MCPLDRSDDGRVDGPGIPQPFERKADWFRLRVNSTEKALIQQAARASCMSASHFMRQAAMRLAEDVVADQNRFVVPAKTWKAFITLLDAATPAESQTGSVAA
jgi:uncharacterized protein (DUF1778 family)